MQKLVEVFKTVNPYLMECPNCGKTIPKHIVACWSCGKVLSAELKALTEATRK